MYGVTIGVEEGLTSYLVRYQELYSQIPTSAGGVSNMSKETVHTSLIKGLKTRPEFAGFVQSYHTVNITDCLGLSSALMQYVQVTSLPESSITGSTLQQELAAGAYRDESTMTCYNCGGYGHSSTHCPSAKTRGAYNPRTLTTMVLPPHLPPTDPSPQGGEVDPGPPPRTGMARSLVQVETEGGRRASPDQGQEPTMPTLQIERHPALTTLTVRMTMWNTTSWL